LNSPVDLGNEEFRQLHQKLVSLGAFGVSLEAVVLSLWQSAVRTYRSEFGSNQHPSLTLIRSSAFDPCKIADALSENRWWSEIDALGVTATPFPAGLDPLYRGLAKRLSPEERDALDEARQIELRQAILPLINAIQSGKIEIVTISPKYQKSNRKFSPIHFEKNQQTYPRFWRITDQGNLEFYNDVGSSLFEMPTVVRENYTAVNLQPQPGRHDIAASGDLSTDMAPLSNVAPPEGSGRRGEQPIFARSRSGTAGRPTSMHLVCSEFERRKAAGEQHSSQQAWGKVLSNWLASEHPNEPQATAKAILNSMRDPIRALVSKSD